MLDCPATNQRTGVRLLGCTLLALTAMAASAAEVYRSTDANGVVVYSDRPVGEHAERVAIVAPRPASRPAAPPAAAAPARSAESTPPAADAPQSEEPPQQTPEQRAEIRARNCEIARER